MTELQRFMSKVDFRQENECWLWLGSLTHNGYPRFALRGGDKTVRAHRYMYENCIGPIPDGYTIDHVKMKGCKFRHCVNPHHLEAVTPLENVSRGDTVIAKNLAKTHCIHGHSFEEHGFKDSQGARQCRICRRLSVKRHREKKLGRSQ